MSIAPMKKLSLFAVGDDCDAIVSGLMKLRCIEIVTADAEKEALTGLYGGAQPVPRLRRTDRAAYERVPPAKPGVLF